MSCTRAFRLVPVILCIGAAVGICVLCKRETDEHYEYMVNALMLAGTFMWLCLIAICNVIFGPMDPNALGAPVGYALALAPIFISGISNTIVLSICGLDQLSTHPLRILALVQCILFICFVCTSTAWLIVFCRRETQDSSRQPLNSRRRPRVVPPPNYLTL